MSIEGGGLVGQVESFARVPPTSQPSMESLTALVNPSEFLGHSVLIIGGSRGIGELTAKLLAAGGARTIVTYRMGKSDAERVAREIRAAGGLCDAMPYDARLPADPQLACLPDVPTHLYYYATPPIQNRSAELYRHERLEELLAVYVAGFQHLAQALYERRPDLSVFYPSTVFIDERPRGMLEYAMAKVAGELLCADLNQTRPNQRILVSRLPRMATDQTAAVIPVDMHSAVATLLPLVRDVQSRFTERA
jgi:NAD(P)-dependent dehydrogenase (short-subunit alcohol dehydrogenase family)